MTFLVGQKERQLAQKYHYTSCDSAFKSVMIRFNHVLLYATENVHSVIQLDKEVQEHCILIHTSQQGDIFLLVYDYAIILKCPVQPS